MTTILPNLGDTVDKIKTQGPPNDGKIDYKQDFFSRPAFLTVSGQLSVETYCVALGDCYTFGPTFRAENSHTKRHLAEFWMIEPELAFADIVDLMANAEAYLKYCVRYVLEKNVDDLAFLDQFVQKGLIKSLEEVRDKEFKRVSYTDCIKVLEARIKKKKAKFENKVEWGIDLASEHEHYLTEKVYNGPIIVYNYPKAIKSFYMRVNEDNITCAAMDVLIPRIGELMGGSQREERLDKIEARIAELNLNMSDY